MSSQEGTESILSSQDTVSPKMSFKQWFEKEQATKITLVLIGC